MSQALRLINPQQSEYTVRWPIYGTNFNTRDYHSLQVILSDLEELLRRTLKDRLDIEAQDYKVDIFILSNDLRLNNTVEFLCRPCCT